jgi:hypothetical protein
MAAPPGATAKGQSMIRKRVVRFPEKIMLDQASGWTAAGRAR